MAEIEPIVVEIKADTTQLVEALDEASRAIREFTGAYLALQPWWIRAYWRARWAIQAVLRRAAHKAGKGC